MITSARNPKIQWVRKLQSQARLRRAEGLFVVEGVRLAEEALRSGWRARLVLHSPALSERGKELVAEFSAREAPGEPDTVLAVADQALAAACDTETPQGILAVLEQQELALPKVLDFVVIADTLRDPGNLGTLLRTAAASGVQAVIATPGTADIYSPKVVRAAMGAHFRLPLRCLDWQAIRALLPGLRVFVADPGGGQPYTAIDLSAPLALVVGGEASGAGGEAHQIADGRLHIPMAREVESLNAATAAAVLIFEVVRQRSGKN